MPVPPALPFDAVADLTDDARLLAVVDACPVPMALNDEQQRITLLNRAFVETYGYTRDDIPDLAAWWPRAYPDPGYRERVAAAWQVELERSRRAGARFVPIEVALVAKDGRTKTALVAAASLGGALQGTHLVTLVDITERKLAEQERARLAAELTQAQKLESVGRLAGGVAHDFNNMLSAILGHVELALEQVDDATSLHDDLCEIRKAAQRSAALTRQLLGFARKQTAEPRVIDLNEAVAGAIRMLRRLIGENVELAWRPGPRLWATRVDPAQVDQILTNLCVNARDAIRDVGHVTIETANVTLDAAFCATHAGAKPGEYVRVAVTDDGAGMTTDTLAHVFEPFFTTKPVGQGTGMGLALVHGVVTTAGGAVFVESAVGQGSTFRVLLPRCEAPPGGAVAAGAGGTVLFVDDEPHVGHVAAQLLTALGYDAVTACTGREAIDAFAARPGDFVAVVTDLAMPEIDGLEVAAAVRARCADVPIVLGTTHTDLVAPERATAAGVTDVLVKPYRRSALARVLARGVGRAARR
jgi:PAS domain S-box-containing protein